MLERTQVFVDTSYLLASFYNSWEMGARAQLEIDLPEVVSVLDRMITAQLGQPIQRQLWYDGISESGPHRYQRALRTCEGVQLRAGQLIEWGERRTQKAVDTRLVADMVVAAMSNQCSDMVLLSGDRDMLPGVEEAARCGIRVHLYGFGWQSMAAPLRHACDTTTILDPRADFEDCMQLQVLEGPLPPKPIPEPVGDIMEPESIGPVRVPEFAGAPAPAAESPTDSFDSTAADSDSSPLIEPTGADTAPDQPGECSDAPDATTVFPEPFSSSDVHDDADVEGEPVAAEASREPEAPAQKPVEDEPVNTFEKTERTIESDFVDEQVTVTRRTQPASNDSTDQATVHTRVDTQIDMVSTSHQSTTIITSEPDDGADHPDIEASDHMEHVEHLEHLEAAEKLARAEATPQQQDDAAVSPAAPKPSAPLPSMMAPRRRLHSRYIPIANELCESTGFQSAFDVGQQYAIWWYRKIADAEHRDQAHELCGGSLPKEIDRPLLQFACERLNEYTLTEKQRVDLRDGFHSGMRYVLVNESDKSQ